MKLRHRAAAVTVAALALLGPSIGAAQATDSPVNDTAPILFQDDFNGPKGHTFDHTKWTDWSTATYNASAAFGDITPGDDETLNGFGGLRIPATPTAGSAIRSNVGFEYGQFSVWAKLPAQSGYWPAFWTLNNTMNGAPNNSIVGEGDVMEQYTMWPTLYHRTAHNWDGDSSWSSPDDPTNCSAGANLTKAYHKYTERIEPDKITFYFDDKQCGAATVNTDGAGKPWAFGPDVSSPNWMILDLAVGGAGGQQTPASANATLLVSRVEVRALS